VAARTVLSRGRATGFPRPDASAPGLSAGRGAYGGLPRARLVDVSQGLESVAHVRAHLLTWTDAPAQSGVSGAKQSESVRAQSVLARADLDLHREDLDLPCALIAFPCPWLEHRPPLWPFHATWSALASAQPAGGAASREVVGHELEHGPPSWRSRSKGLAPGPT
jgi:hypothetical protein